MDASDYSLRLKNTGRNDLCPCGSGKKYKKCHLEQDEAAKHRELAEAAEKREAALEAEADAEDDAPVKKAKKSYDEHQKSGKAHRSESGPTSLPRRGAI